METSMSQASTSSDVADPMDPSVKSLDPLTLQAIERHNEEDIDIQEESYPRCCLVHEGACKRVYRFDDPMNNFGGRTGAVAITVISDQFPSVDLISRLDNEHDMSKRLSIQCKSVRAALGRSNSEINSILGDESHTLYLEWVPGFTLREWVHLQQKDSRYKAVMESCKGGKGVEIADDDWVQRRQVSSICLAWRIAKSLSEIHEADAVHGKLSSDNIIVNVSKGDFNGDPSEISIYFTGLGSASFVQRSPVNCENSSYTMDRKTGHDLQSLGEVLYELFSGQVTDQGNQNQKRLGSLTKCDNRSSKKRKCGSSIDLQSSLDSPLIPARARDLVLSLLVANIDAGGGASLPFRRHYKSATEVEQDLYLLLLDRSCCFSKIANKKNDGDAGCFNFIPEKLYGRREQEMALIDAYKRVIMLGNTNEVVVVSGFSGVGKTTLVKEVLRKPLTHRGGHFLHIKFDQRYQGKPLAAIVATFNEFCDDVLDGDKFVLGEIKDAIRKNIEAEPLSILCGIIQNLNKLVGDVSPAEKNKVNGLMAQNQFKFVIQSFVKSIASPANPIVLFLDDLQWADTTSLTLVQTLMMDPKKNSLLCIESYRENEINDDHPLNTHLRNFEHKGVSLTEIIVKNLDEEDVNELLSDALCEIQSVIKPLSDSVYVHTSGNLLHTIQFVKSLWDEGILRYSFTQNAWEWNIAAIKSKDVVHDAVHIMAHRILSFPLCTQQVLKKMACIGSQCDQPTLSLIADDELKEFSDCKDENTSSFPMLEVAIRKGLVMKVDFKYKFAHDQIQRAAYSLIPEKDRELWHLEIGKQILKLCNTDDLGNMIFTIVDQMNRGKELINEENKKIHLAQLNYQAGKNAMSSAGFQSAALYFKTGLHFLDEKHWKDNYELYLQLCDSYASAEYCNGQFDDVKQVINSVFTHAKCIGDKLHMYSMVVFSLGAQKKLGDAIEFGLEVMKEYGEIFPAHPDESSTLEEFRKTKTLLEGENGVAVLAQKHMNDKHMLALMSMLESLALYAYYSKQQYLPFFTFRLIQLSVHHGLCESTAFAFATYSMLLCNTFDDIKGANCYGKLSLEILEHVDAKHKLARTFAVVYGTVFTWSEDLHSCLKPLLEGYHAGLNNGDNEFAMLNATGYCILAFACGERLVTIERFLQEVEKKMTQNHQETMWQQCLPYRQIVLLLMGKDEFSSSANIAQALDPQLMNATKMKDLPQMYRIYSDQMQLAYMCGDYDLAAEKGEKSFGLYKCVHGFKLVLHAFFEGLNALALARKTKATNLVGIANKALENMKIWKNHCPCNTEHKLYLLEAEYAFLMDDDDAKTKYDSSIMIAGRNGFLQDQALAYERAGIYHVEKGREAEASTYFAKAHSAYLGWGAKGKANHLQQLYSF